LQNGFALQYASERLRNNKTVVDAAISKDKKAINFASEEIKKLLGF